MQYCLEKSAILGVEAGEPVISLKQLNIKTSFKKYSFSVSAYTSTHL